MKIILGSSSPRRKQIIGKIINKFDIISPNIIEEVIDGESPLQFSERISKKKAASITSQKIYNIINLVITCDTIVTIDDKIIGKPMNFQHAKNILQLLNGKTHEVISSITLHYNDNDNDNKIITDSEKSLVTFKILNKKDIINYLHKIDYLDKAGGYAIQNYGDHIIDFIDGSISNVIGFPLRLFYKMLFELGLLEKIFISSN